MGIFFSMLREFVKLDKIEEKKPILKTKLSNDDDLEHYIYQGRSYSFQKFMIYYIYDK